MRLFQPSEPASKQAATMGAAPLALACSTPQPNTARSDLSPEHDRCTVVLSTNTGGEAPSNEKVIQIEELPELSMS